MYPSARLRVMRAVAWLLASVSAWGADCARTSTGLPAFTDPYPPSYRNFSVGLYPNGSTARPDGYEQLGLKYAALVAPRARDGSPDAQGGRVVVLSIGMSNTTQEYSAFLQLAARDPLRDPRVTLVDGAVGGASADFIVANPTQYWANVDGRLAAAGVTAAQVQVAWVKLADAGPRLSFPEDARKLQSEIEKILFEMMVPRFPNLKLVYLSSRIYAGYATTTLNPEPYAYQSGFAVKWLIEGRMNSDAAPWVVWGPYLWADGLTPRWDGLTWACTDLRADDGTHPSAAGMQKVARMLLDFFQSDTTARTWYLAPQAAGTAPAVGAVVNAAGYGKALATGSLATVFGSHLAETAAQADRLPLPRSLAGTRVEVDGQPALLYYVSPGQINFVLPPTGGQKVVVIRGGTASAAAEIQTTFWGPGLFTLDGLVEGPAAVLHADGSVVTAASPARAGETLQAFGTGLGVLNPLLMMPLVAPVIHVGGVYAELQYGGRSPGWPGVTQINFVVPPDAPAGSAVPLVFSIGGARSNAATLSVAR